MLAASGDSATTLSAAPPLLSCVSVSPAIRLDLAIVAAECANRLQQLSTAERFLADARTTPDRPWFLYLAYHAPHFPHHARPEDIAKYRDRYAGGWDRLRRERLARSKR